VLYPSYVKRRSQVGESCHGQVPSPIKSVVMSVPIKANFGSVWSKVLSHGCIILCMWVGLVYGVWSECMVVGRSCLAIC
jgi:hypothetical protein